MGRKDQCREASNIILTENYCDKADRCRWLCFYVRLQSCKCERQVSSMHVCVYLRLFCFHSFQQILCFLLSELERNSLGRTCAKKIRRMKDRDNETSEQKGRYRELGDWQRRDRRSEEEREERGEEEEEHGGDRTSLPSNIPCFPALSKSAPHCTSNSIISLYPLREA